MKNDSLAKDWLSRAESNFVRAANGKIEKKVLYEDLCFDCQQAAEKALKALLVHNDINFPLTHSIALLLELLERFGIKVSADIKKTMELSEYAVFTRYPGDYEPITKEEYEVALKYANKVVTWVKRFFDK